MKKRELQGWGVKEEHQRPVSSIETQLFKTSII
jgi:hypothetical protein